MKRKTFLPDGIKDYCSDFFGRSCGGCMYQNIDYAAEIKIKEEAALEALAEFASGGAYRGIEAAPRTEGYRNKMEYAFGDEHKDGTLSLGVRKRGNFYEVVSPEHCTIVDSDFRAAALAARDFFIGSGETFYHRKLRTGTLRHLVVRKSAATGETLVNVVTTSGIKKDLREFTKLMTSLQLNGNICGVLHTINDAVSDTVTADRVNVLCGRDFYLEKLCGLDFKVSAFSFFQTFPEAAGVLYGEALGLAKNFGAGCGLLYDLYCGTGTITQIFSRAVKKAVGVEINEGAIKAARENARLNGTDNCEFFSCDVLDWLDTEEANKQQPDMIVLDPPRDGVHPKALKKIVCMDAPHVIYISCKPQSLARDLAEFCKSGYTPVYIKLHDMFPRTAHVETLCLLKKN
ncbi:MAG: 23S rRNA (uracil(1939)-C(5))-methyltransferase RlmD [Defluviitaleaceae bacterium]|nr:23S rRNA (uracil(1939)-C(5))-methyltransferase RlmD [Defluviitaleaceae bacterium]